MKFIQFLIPAVFITLAATSCHKGKLFVIKGKGSNVTQTRSVTGFDEIHLSMNADVYYVQDSVYSVEISAQSNILSVLRTDVEGSKLEIEFDTRVMMHSKITITVHSPNINGFFISGSGKIEAQNAVSSNNMTLKISGSGDLKIASLTASNLDASISGSGNVSVYGGTVQSEDLSISGSGDVDMLNATAANATAKISGSGNLSLHVTDNLTANISGSGDISYTGNPAMNVSISGSGKIIHL